MQINKTEFHTNGGLCSALTDETERTSLFISRRPELEDFELVEKGLQEARAHVGKKALIDLYHGTITDGMCK